MRSVRIRVPATSANLGSGFDICGIALAMPYDEMRVSVASADSVRSVGRYSVPESLGENTCGPVVASMKRDFGIGEGIGIVIEKGIKPGGGLGSSAASAAGTAFCIDRLFTLRLSKEKLVHYASLGESVSAGIPHIDNVAPAIFGGFTIVVGREPIRIRKVHIKRPLDAIVVLPEKGKPSTKAARAVLPESIARQAAQRNMERLASLICSCIDSDVKGVIRSMGDDIAEPAREGAGMLPHFYEIKKLGERFGYGVAASGAGPAVLLLGESGNPKKSLLLKGVKEIFLEKHEIIASSVQEHGITVL